MAFKLFAVTAPQLKGGRVKHKVIGFVSVFGWENEEKKAQAKYEGHVVSGVYEVPKGSGFR